MIVDKSWLELSWGWTLINPHPRLAWAWNPLRSITQRQYLGLPSSLCFKVSKRFLDFIVRCVVNCKEKMDISTRLSLTTTCTGPGCNMATYQWQLQALSSSGASVSPADLTRDMTETNLNLPSIVVKGNQLPRYRTYRLMVTVTPDGSPAGKAAYQFGTNIPPYPGGCLVSSYSGVALKTEFYFSCDGWMVNFFGVFQC